MIQIFDEIREIPRYEPKKPDLWIPFIKYDQKDITDLIYRMKEFIEYDINPDIISGYIMIRPTSLIRYIKNHKYIPGYYRIIGYDSPYEYYMLIAEDITISCKIHGQGWMPTYITCGKWYSSEEKFISKEYDWMPDAKILVKCLK